MANYIKREELLNLLKEYQKTKSNKVYNQIGTMFILLARNYLNKSSLINYTEDRKQEMISDATYYMCKLIDRYDVTRENPFSYFTTVVKNAFLQYLNERNKYDQMFTSIEYIENYNKDGDFQIDTE